MSIVPIKQQDNKEMSQYSSSLVGAYLISSLSLTWNNNQKRIWTLEDFHGQKKVYIFLLSPDNANDYFFTFPAAYLSLSFPVPFRVLIVIGFLASCLFLLLVVPHHSFPKSYRVF